MDCLVLRTRRRSMSMGYRPLTKDGMDESEAVTVVVGKEKRVFVVDPFILQENPFRALIDTTSTKKDRVGAEKGRDFHFRTRRQGQCPVIFVDVDAILFEHMLWLMHNDCSSLFKLNLEDIIDFYTQEE
ncbi:hypothetical protein L6164_019754 [Bauhinia variegata]|uniref:Uncharacterized protein n=1 Tax=Bauhinia variegata TaxID=167791 RepID=A0ACB9MW99_BAUVA|nr:hypothetical protein L6164_019754 [Bauhinia variegata]